MFLNIHDIIDTCYMADHIYTTTPKRDIAQVLPSLFIISWIGITIFHHYDQSYYIFISLMELGSLFTIYNQFMMRSTRDLRYLGTILFYVLTWFGISLFAPYDALVTLSTYQFELRWFEIIAIIPIMILWLIPLNKEKFFGIQRTTEEDRIKWLWKSVIVILILINFLELSSNWQFIVLIPMIAEPVLIQREKEKELPMLTLFIHQEVINKFDVPISLIRTIFIILFAFMFNYLTSKWWVIILLLFMMSTVFWGIGNVVNTFNPEKESKLSEHELEEFIKKGILGDEIRSKMTSVSNTIKDVKTKNEKVETSKANENEKSEVIKDEEGIVTPKRVISTIKQDAITTMPISENKPIKSSSKAHELGLKLRKELQKPRYNLNHILSTLTSETFNVGYKVNQENLIFNSLKGPWTPPLGLILFPVDLGRYDFRRSNQILLLGFNKPIHRPNQAKIDIEFSPKYRYNAVISGDRIQFGDLEFNMRTLIVTKQQWEEINQKLDLVTENDDIEYTGFKTLSEMQQKLVEIGDKWVDLRRQAQEAVVNFIAGLLGSEEPIFTDIKKLKASLDEYEIVEDK